MSIVVPRFASALPLPFSKPAWPHLFPHTYQLHPADIFRLPEPGPRVYELQPRLDLDAGVSLHELLMRRGDPREDD